ncbi:ubiquinone biosynthesis accessory factor UbiJ [Rheinheimera maricola]|uniref:Ubiquinone biosynthesis accessory factor UbiJ n=1 Tax=Rheinheimera maricola TaxID=2793282 RepID=A0ABS7XEB8_9GAMM|nr:SCP2 sterol-binding domain-containing protein [Rheinheimera maricola]MBZ9613671.1 SCP2 sterol-binding domain-containing protein [Rheinheimera maricola]
MLPLLPQLLCATAEKAIAQLIAMDPTASSRLTRLAGKQLSFRLKEWPTTLVLGANTQSILFNQHDETVDCAIQTDLASLRLLRDPSQLTRLIKADALQIDGDIQVAQQYSAFFQQLDPDWQQTLSRYFGDALSHKISSSLQQLHQYLSSKTAALQQMSVELAQDELQLSPTAAEMAQFSSAVSLLAAKADILQQQLQLFREL